MVEVGDNPYASPQRKPGGQCVWLVFLHLALGVPTFVTTFFAEVAVFEAPRPIWDYMADRVSRRILAVVIVASVFQAVRILWHSNTFRFRMHTIIGGAVVAAITPSVIRYIVRPSMQFVMQTNVAFRPPNIPTITVENIFFFSAFLVAATLFIATECAVNWSVRQVRAASTALG